MRASILSFVVATGCWYLCGVRAQVGPVPASQGPTNITVAPSTLISNEPFTITWQDDTANCFIGGVNLVEVDAGEFNGVVSVILPSCTAPGLKAIGESCTTVPVESSIKSATGTAPETLSPTKTYRVDILWATTTGVTVPVELKSQPATELLAFAFSPSSTSTIPSSSISPTRPVQPSSVAVGVPTGTKSSGTQTTSPALSSSAMSTNAASTSSSSDSGSLSTGAKVGIAIGAIGFALLILIAALLMWRRSRQRRLGALPSGAPYSHDIDSTNRDFTVEKELQVISSPVDTLNNGYSSVPPAAETQNRSPRGSWTVSDDHNTGSAAVAAAPYTDTHRGLYGSGYEDSASPAQESQAHIPAAGAGIQRKPVGVASGPVHHLREPGMSDEEVARLEEEERRLDEAIAEAERKRQLQG